MDLFPAVKTIGTHAKSVTAVKFSPSGDFVISASADQTCHLYQTVSGECCQTLNAEHAEGLNDVVWLNNTCSNTTVATASDDKTIKIWDVETGAVVSTLEGHDNFVFTLAAHPFQSYLMSGSEDESIRLWDLRCASRCVHALAEAHAEPITSVSFHPTGDHVASSSYDGLVRMWDFRTLVCRRTLQLSDPLTPIAHSQYTPNGRYLLTSTLDSTIRLLRPLHTCIAAGSTSSDEAFYAVNAHKRLKRSCPVRSIETVKAFRGHVNRKYSCPSVFVDASDLDHDEERGREFVNLEKAENTILLSGSEDFTVCAWSLQSQKLLGRLQGHTGPVLALDANGPGRVGRGCLLASGAGGSDCSVRLWGSKQEEQEPQDGPSPKPERETNPKVEPDAELEAPLS